MFSKKLAIILVLGAVIRFWLVFTAAGINSDAYKYALTAQRMAESGVVSGFSGDFFWPYPVLNKRLVVYPFLGSLVYKITGDAIVALRLVSALSGIALIWVLYMVAKELFKEEGIALLSAALVAFHPELTRASASVYREVLMALLLVLAFLFLLWSIRSRRGWPIWAFAVGMLSFAAFLTRPDGVVAAMAFGTIALFVAPDVAWKKRLGICLIIGLTFCVAEAPYMFWMKKATGRWLLTPWQLDETMLKTEGVEFLLKEGASQNGAVR